MAELERSILPANERPDNFRDFSYSPIFTPREILPEIHVTITFTFDRRDPNSFFGHSYRILDGERGKCEAQSFLDAAEKAWARYEKTEDKYKKFVKISLKAKWKELKGKKLTGKILPFKEAVAVVNT